MALFQRSQLFKIVVTRGLQATMAFGVMAGVILFSSSRIERITQSIQDLRKLAAISENRASSTALLRSELQSRASVQKAMHDALISPEDSLDFLAFLESTAAKTGMTQKVRFATPVSHAGTEIPTATLDYTVELVGTQQTLSQYLGLLEAGRYYNSVTSIALNSTTPQGWNGTSNIVLSGKLYVRE